MSTRGFVGFVVDGVEKIAYNHCDSYPEGLGVAVYDWLVTNSADMTGEGGLLDLARELRVVGHDSQPTDEDIERLSKYLRPDVGEHRDRPDWYQLLRETQGDPAKILDAGVIEDGSGFPLDSLFAEWGYLVDLDVGVFEVYRGFQHAKHDRGRFAAREGRNDGYYPCALEQTWPLSALPASPEEFLAAFAEDEDDS